MGQVCSFCNPDGPGGEPAKKGALLDVGVGVDPSSVSTTAAANDGDAWSARENLNEHGGIGIGGGGAGPEYPQPPPSHFPPGGVGAEGGRRHPHHQQHHHPPPNPTQLGPEDRKRLEEETRLARLAEAERRRAEAAAAETERARLDSIVGGAMRDMVSTGPRHQHRAESRYGGGGPGDYPGGTALSSIAVGRTSTSSFRGEVPPASAPPSDVMDVLSPGLWENVAALGTGGGRDGGPGGWGGGGLAGFGWMGGGGGGGVGQGEDPNIYLDDCAEGFLAGALPARQGEKRFRGVAPIVENLP